MKTIWKHFVVLGIFAIALVVDGLKKNAFHFGWNDTENSQGLNVDRSPASYPVECFENRLTEENLRKEIEAMLPKSSETFKYSHGVEDGESFELSKLNEKEHKLLSNRQYLSSKGQKSWIHFIPEQKGCETYECLVKKLYPETSKLGGLMHFWFYLKTGYGLSSQDFYLETKGTAATHMYVEGLTYKDFMWSEDELKAHWWNANALPQVMLYLPKLNWIHRLPTNHWPSAWKSNGVMAHNISWYGGEFIQASYICNSLISGKLYDGKGEFYGCITHEMAHSLDRYLAKDGARVFSEMESFKKLSGWNREELVTEQGVVKKDWTYSKDAKFSTWYASASPLEDFAELVGYFRSRPDTGTKAPEKYEFIKTQVFGGRGFTKAELIKDYSEWMVQKVEKNIELWSKKCEGLENGSEYKPRFDASLRGLIPISLAVNQKTKECFQDQILNEVAQEKARIKYEEMEGCSVFQQNEAEIQKLALTKVSTALPMYFKTLQNAPVFFEVLRDLRKQLTMKPQAWEEFFLTCLKDQDTEGCTVKKANEQFDLSLDSLKKLKADQFVGVGDEVIEKERKRFVDSLRYSVLLPRARDFAMKVVLEVQNPWEQAFSQFWKNCFENAIQDSVGEVLYAPYSGSDRYLTPGLITCLNVEWSKELKSAPLHRDSRMNAWVEDQYLLPLIHKITDVQVGSESQKDWERLNAQLEKNKAAWAEEMEGAALFGAACELEIAKRVQAVFGSEKIFFVAPEPIILKTQKEQCVSTEARLREKYSDEAMWVLWKNTLIEKAQPRYAKCSSRIYITSKLKRKCLFESWEQLVAETNTAWLENKLVKTAQNQFGAVRDWSERISKEDAELKEAVFNDFSSK